MHISILSSFVRLYVEYISIVLVAIQYRKVGCALYLMWRLIKPRSNHILLRVFQYGIFVNLKFKTIFYIYIMQVIEYTPLMANSLTDSIKPCMSNFIKLKHVCHIV